MGTHSRVRDIIRLPGSPGRDLRHKPGSEEEQSRAVGSVSCLCVQLALGTQPSSLPGARVKGQVANLPCGKPHTGNFQDKS